MGSKGSAYNLDDELGMRTCWVMVEHAFSLSAWEGEAGRCLQASLLYTVNLNIQGTIVRAFLKYARTHACSLARMNDMVGSSGLESFLF